jgi:hypothetical protein
VILKIMSSFYAFPLLGVVLDLKRILIMDPQIVLASAIKIFFFFFGHNFIKFYIWLNFFFFFLISVAPTSHNFIKFYIWLYG